MFDGPILDPRIAAIAPGFRAVSLLVDAKKARLGSLDADLLAKACDAVLAGGPNWAEVHLENWNQTYVRFGAKPNRTPCSARALRKRVLKEGRIPQISPIVDLYNAVSLKYAIPVGGENYDAYVGPPRLTIADGTESFDTVLNGETVNENPGAGEVIWRDDVGVTCRRWNWRQCVRTRLVTATGRMWFVLEALVSMPQEALEEARDALAEGLLQLLPGCEISSCQVSVPID